MGKRRDIMYSYHKENCEDRFEFMYEHYYYYKTVLSSRKACIIYSIESYMRKEHWDEYFKLYNVQKREALISRVLASMDKGESIDYLICEEGLPESILEHYKDYLAMKIDFRIFSCALKSIGGKDVKVPSHDKNMWAGNVVVKKKSKRIKTNYNNTEYNNI